MKWTSATEEEEILQSILAHRRLHHQAFWVNASFFSFVHPHMKMGQLFSHLGPVVYLVNCLLNSCSGQCRPECITNITVTLFVKGPFARLWVPFKTRQTWCFSQRSVHLSGVTRQKKFRNECLVDLISFVIVSLAVYLPSLESPFICLYNEFVRILHLWEEQQSYNSQRLLTVCSMNKV